MVVVDFLLAGFVSATILWIFTNKYLRSSQILDSDVEWGYSFDVHLNAFFPPLMLLHFIQLFFYNSKLCAILWQFVSILSPSSPCSTDVIAMNWLFSRIFGNTIWLMALTYYIYITFLGYNCIPFLKNTRVILAPLTLVFLFYLVTIIIGWNVTITFMNFYHYRVLWGDGNWFFVLFMCVTSFFSFSFCNIL